MCRRFKSAPAQSAMTLANLGLRGYFCAHEYAEIRIPVYCASKGRKARMSEQAIVTMYVDCALAGLRRSDTMRVPDPRMPVEMRSVDRPQRDDWIPWNAIDSTVSKSDIEELELHFGGPLPKLYAALLEYKHFYELTESCLRFEQHLVGRWKDDLLSKYDWLREHVRCGSHLVPIGEESFMDAGPVCLDFGQRRSDGDCAIVFWDHEWVGTDKEINPMFSSSTKMFECLLFEAESLVDFLHLDSETDTQESVELKRKHLFDFLAIDPEGAGGNAREYWASRLG